MPPALTAARNGRLIHGNQAIARGHLKLHPFTWEAS